MLSDRDQAAIVTEMVDWMTGELIREGVDETRVVVRGYYRFERHDALLVVAEKSDRRSSWYRPFPDRTIARATVAIEHRRTERPAAIEGVMRVLREHCPHLILEQETLEIPTRPPTEEDLAQVQRIVAESRARRDQRPSRRRGGGSGTPGRTTDTP